ncbi:hypothetical protein T03_76 [Trichinella britovi]|uniref:Uncharacterized protein n=1 Tax=Trichinella britovi TaxID=45882 RepID=A0A0V0Z8K5_TRIBR|nr:hypothetical protein T03_76 [Trichinella britovi]
MGHKTLCIKIDTVGLKEIMQESFVLRLLKQLGEW